MTAMDSFRYVAERLDMDDKNAVSESLLSSVMVYDNSKSVCGGERVEKGLEPESIHEGVENESNQPNKDFISSFEDNEVNTKIPINGSSNKTGAVKK